MFEISHSNQSKNFLKKIDKSLAERIIKKIEILREKPIIHDIKRIEGFQEKIFRIRIGDYRVLYEIDYTRKIVGVIKIDKRSKVY